MCLTLCLLAPFFRFVDFTKMFGVLPLSVQKLEGADEEKNGPSCCKVPSHRKYLITLLPFPLVNVFIGIYLVHVLKWRSTHSKSDNKEWNISRWGCMHSLSLSSSAICVSAVFWPMTYCIFSILGKSVKHCGCNSRKPMRLDGKMWGGKMKVTKEAKWW